MKVREMLEKSVQQLDEKAKDAFTAGNQSAFYRFIDAKYRVKQAIAILRVAPMEYDRNDAPENIKMNGEYTP